MLLRARDVLNQLESQNRERPASTLVDDLPLFSSLQLAPVPKPAKSSAIADELAAINPDELTPREALEALYRLKNIDQ